MESTIISRFQRLQASTKSLLHSLFYSFSVLSPSAYFQCVDTLLFISKHAKGISLRYDTPMRWECRKDENETIARTGIGDAASCETPCKRKSQSDWAQLGDKNIVWRRASERVGYDYEEKILIPQPTLSEAPVVSTLLSPSCASLQARTLAWCFASFGISDAFTCAFIYPPPHAIMQTIA